MLLVALLLTSEATYVVPPANLESAPYAEWAHYHWVWLSADRANQSNNIQFVQSFIDHNIPVGAVNCDSNWQTGYDDFIPNTSVYPNVTDMVQYFHKQGQRVIFWIVSMVNTDSPNYSYGKNNSFYIVRGIDNQPAVVSWWHGDGSFIDYYNPKALAWWHSMMDGMLATGIDGWKCDGTDPYIFEVPDAQAYNGSITYRDYADAYYGDFFDYTRQVNGPDCLIMSRPVDGLKYHTPIYLPFSPRRVVFSGWTGDDDADFGGLRSAITKFLFSAEAKYPNFGSDIGGYRYDGDYAPNGRSKESFIRWAEVCAFVPLMENGGNGEHRPWVFDSPGDTTIVDTYRKFVNAHYELVPFLLTTGTNAYENVSSSLEPVIPVYLEDLVTPSFDFYLGGSFLVCPIVYNETVREIAFPGPSTRTYTSYWNSREVFKGNQNVTYPCPLTTLPVFIVGGSLIPLRITNDLTGRGSHHFPKALSVLVSRPLSDQYVSLPVREFGTGGLLLSYMMTSSSSQLLLTSSAFRPRNPLSYDPSRIVSTQPEHWDYNEIIFVVEGLCVDKFRLSVTQDLVTGHAETLTHLSSLDELSLSSSGFFYDHHLTRLTIRPSSTQLGVRLVVHHPQLQVCQV